MSIQKQLVNKLTQVVKLYTDIKYPGSVCREVPCRQNRGFRVKEILVCQNAAVRSGKVTCYETKGKAAACQQEVVLQSVPFSQ